MTTEHTDSATPRPRGNQDSVIVVGLGTAGLRVTEQLLHADAQTVPLAILRADGSCHRSPGSATPIGPGDSLILAHISGGQP